jgi:hypothetical protein
MTNAKELTAALRGKWHGSSGMAPCPICQPERRKDQRGLSLSNGVDGILLVRCFKGGCEFRDIAAAAGIAPGTYRAPDPALLAKRMADERAEVKKRAAQALRLWLETAPIESTLAETYLRARGITCPLPDTLRFAPSCWHATARRFPALVAMAEGSEAFALHRTYLLHDGSGKAEVEPSKAMLGPVGGGAVRLTGGEGRLVVAEGIETALSLASGLLQTPAIIWAALSTSGIRGLHLPPQPGRLTIAPDGDDAGRKAAHALADRAHGLGWQVSLLPAPDGRDWNDILTGKAVAA